MRILIILVLLAGTARADAVDELAEIASRVGLDTASHEAARLVRAAHVAEATIEVALQLADANPATAATQYWSVTLGAGDLRAPERERAGELAVAGGVAVSGPTCTLLDAGARAALATRSGPTVTQYGRVCLGGFDPDPTYTTPDTRAEALAVRAYESIGINVRPAVDAGGVIDGRRFSLAEAGLSMEGLRWYWHRRRWSIAGGSVAASQSILTRSVDGDRQWLARLTAAAWFAELRYHRDRNRLGDFMLRLLPIAHDGVELGQANSTLSLVPLEMIGFGWFGVYIDAAGGLDLTSDDLEETEAEIAAKPDVAIGSWRLALRLGVPELHAELVSRQRLMPTLDDGIVAETRSSAALRLDLGPVFADAEAHRARLRIYHGSGDDVDREVDVWGVRGETWLRAGRHLLIGATVEVGRSFVFGVPSPDGSAPRFGHLVLAQVGWQSSKTLAIE